MDEPEQAVRRYLIATGVTAGLEKSGGRIVESVASMSDLLVGELGFTRVGGLDIDPTKDEMEKGVRDFCGQCSPDDLLVIYHTGHGDLVGGRHRLWMGDATGDRLTGTLPTADLAELALTDTPLRHLLLIIDACFAGHGGAQSLAAGMEAIGSSKDKTLTVLAGAHPREQVRAGDFAGLFKEAVHHRATAGHEPRHLLPQALADYMKDSPNRKKWQTISCSTLFGTMESQRFFPNPRHDVRLHGFDVLTQTMMREQEEREQDLRTHFLPRARGGDGRVEASWRFVGRHAALRELTRWLGDVTEGSLRVVTGDPGSGKSALLARLAVLSDPRWREAVPLDGVPADTVPGPGAIDVPVHARGRTSEQILAALAAAAQVSVSTPGELLLAVQGRGLVAIIDAVDEAVDPDRVVSWLLQPLIRGAPAAGLRLLIGTRKHLADRLGTPEDQLDLDASEYVDQPSLRQYVIRCLRESVPSSLFGDASDEVTDPVATAVAEAAGRSFLVALIVSRTLAAGEQIPDASDQIWRASLPGTAADAMHQDLETLGAEAERARELLRPLAYANGAGLPWAGMWAPLAAELSGHPYGDEDIVWLMRHAGAYVVEAEEEGSSVYRLYHLALAEYLRRGRSEQEANDAYVTYLENRVPEVSPGHRDWTMAPGYTRAHIATHARAASRFGRFVTDGLYLATANPAAVVAALAFLTDQEEASAAAAYQRALHLLRNTTIAERLSYLELWGQRLGAEALVAHISGSPLTRAWTTNWVQWPVEYPHRVLPGHNGAVTSAVALDGEPSTAVTVGWDGDLYVWDLRSAEPLAIRKLGNAPLLSARAATAPGDPGMIGVIDAALLLHRVDIGTWTQRKSIMVATWASRLIAVIRQIPVPALMCDVLSDGRLVAYVGGKGLRPRVWDLRSGDLVADLRGAGPEWTPVSFGELRNHRPVLLMRRAGRWVDHQYWDLVSGRPLVDAPTRPRHVRENDPTLDYYRDARGRPVAAAVFGRQTTFLDLTVNAEFLYADGPRGRAWMRMPTAQAQKMIATRYPDAELVQDVTEENPVVQAIERAGHERPRSDLPFANYANDGQAFQFSRVKQGRRETVTLSGHTAAITEIDGARVGDHSMVLTASNDGSARLWDLTSISRLALAGPIESGPDSSSPIYRLAVGTLPDGDRVVLSLGAAGAVLWDLQRGGKRAELAGVSMSGSAAVVLTDDGYGGLSAVVFGADGCAHVWDAATGQARRAFGIDPINWVGQAVGIRRADGTVVLVTSGHGARSLSWDLPGWKFHKVMRGHAGWSAAVDCGWDDRGRPVAVTGGTDGRVCLWDLKSFRRRRRLRSVRRWWLFVRRQGAARVGALRLLGFPLAALLTHDGRIRIMNLRTGRIVADGLAGADHLAAAVLTDGRTVVATATEAGRIAVWQVLLECTRRHRARLEEVTRIELEVPVTDLELEPNGLLVLGTAHGVSCLQITLEPDEAGLRANRTPAASGAT